MESAYSTLINRKVANECASDGKSTSCLTATLAKDGKSHPRVSKHTCIATLLANSLKKVVTLGGDHAVVSLVLIKLLLTSMGLTSNFVGLAHPACFT